MSPELARAVQRLEMRALAPSITTSQRGLLTSLRELGATKIAQTLEDVLQSEKRVREDALETAAFLRRTVK